MWGAQHDETDENLLKKSSKICIKHMINNYNLYRNYTKEFVHLENLSDDEDEIIDNEMENLVRYPITFYYSKNFKYFIKNTGIRQFINHNQHMLHPIVSKLAIHKSENTFDKSKYIINFKEKKNVEFCISSEYVLVERICQNYSYLNYFEENQIINLLSLACAEGYYELVQELIAMNIDVDKPNFNENCTALMEAARAGHADIVCLLLSHGANVNAHSTTKNSSLIYGCAGGHKEVVRVLLEAGANVEHHNKDGCTPLKTAAKAGHVPIVKILLKHGAKCNTRSNEFKESALILASYKGHLEIVRLLLEADSQKHDTNDMYLALVTASIGGHLEVARLLLDTGASANMSMDSCESPLLLAAWKGHTEFAELLLDRGAKITEINSKGYNPLMQAAREGHVKIVALLLSRNVYVNAQNEETGETALMLACYGGFFDVVDHLIKANVDINLGRPTALMIAAQEGHTNIVRYLLNCGANVQAQTEAGNTALTYACENGHTVIAKLLFLFNAKLEHKSVRGATPLMNACVAGHFNTVQFLISARVNINYQTENGQTALALASMAGHIAIVALLLDCGANRNCIFEDNWTTIMGTVICNQPHITILLLDKLQFFRTYKYGMNNEFIFGNYFSSWKSMLNSIHQLICNHKQIKFKLLKFKNEMKDVKEFYDLYCEIKKYHSFISI